MGASPTGERAMPGGFREGEKSSRQGSGQESRGLAVGVGFVLLCLCEAEIWLLFYNAAVFRPKGDFLEELEKKAYIPLRKKLRRRRLKVLTPRTAVTKRKRRR